MKNRRWQNLALGIAFALPVIGVYVGKRLISNARKRSPEALPPVTRIRIPLTSLIGINEGEETKTSSQPPIVLPEANEVSTAETPDQNTASELDLYIASLSGGKFHRSCCRWAKNIKPDNSLTFQNKSDAIERGFTPCGTCNP